ncbi:MAG: ABC transporter ATP-binding protein [Acidimicrobiales bacterium]
MLLELEDIHVHYGQVEALKGVSIAVSEGEMVTLIGANGAGKTTTLRTISGLRRVSSGRITFGGEDITRIPGHRRVELGLCQVPEGRGIFPGMTVAENLEMGIYARHGGRRQRAKADFGRVYELFPRLAERRKQAGGTLSGGEQQMLAIGRALMAEPALLMLDEPSMGLAPLIVAQIFEVLSEVNRQGMTVLLIEQNAVQALQRADRAYVLETGTVAQSGRASDLLADESVRAAYLGVAKPDLSR